LQIYKIFTVAVSNLHYKIVFSFPSASEGECDSNKLIFNDLRHLCCWLVVNCWYMNLILALIFMIITYWFHCCSVKRVQIIRASDWSQITSKVRMRILGKTAAPCEARAVDPMQVKYIRMYVS